MKTQLKLNIPTPCLENWQEMAASEQGRSCQQCFKTVIDFTSFTEDQLIAFFSQKQGNVCGRFTKQQIATKAHIKTEKPNRSRAFILLLSGLLGITAGKVAAQTSDMPIDLFQSTIIDKDGVKTIGETKLLSDNFKIVGHLVDSLSGQPLPGVSVSVAERSFNTSTKDDGSFELILPEKPSKPINITFHYIGYITIMKDININESTTFNIGKVSMSPDMHVMGEVVIHYNPNNKSLLNSTDTGNPDVRFSGNPFVRFWWKLRSAIGI